MDITPIVQVTANGLTQMQQLGLAGVLGSFLLIGMAVAIWHCESRRKADVAARAEEAKINREAYQAEAAANREVLSGLNNTLTGVQIAIAKLEGKLDK